MFGEMTQHRRTGFVQPSLAVGGHPRFLGIGDQPPALVVCHPVAGGRLNQPQILCPHRPQRAAHRQVFEQGAVLLQLGVQVSDGETGHPRPQR